MTPHQLAVKDKTNDIGAVPDLLIDLVIEGRVFTMDALLTQRPVAQTIIDDQGDYVMLVKDNHPTMRADIEFLFAEPREATLINDMLTTTDKVFGRLEVRTLQTSTALDDYLDWPGLEQAFRLDRKRTMLKTGEVRTESVYGLSSLSAQRAGAAQLLELIRGQWST